MRLTETERHGLIQALQLFINHHPAELRLFGSRTRDDLRGGDIDLLLITDNNNLKLEKHKILSAMKAAIGDQKIDLMIAASKDIDDDEFVQMILPESISLHIWK